MTGVDLPAVAVGGALGTALALLVGLPPLGVSRVASWTQGGPAAAVTHRGLTALTAGRRWAAPAIAGLGALAAAAALGPGAALVVFALVSTLLGGLRRRAEIRLAAEERDGAVAACSTLAAELRAGRMPADALAAAAAAASSLRVGAGPFRQRLALAAASAQLGGDVAAQLGEPIEGCAVPEVLAGLAACWRVSAGAGGGLAAGVDRLAEGLRSTAEIRRRRDAELAGPRASAALLAALPVVGLSLAAGLGAAPADLLLHTPLGLGCLAAGTVLDLAGLRWTRAIVDRAGGE